MEMIHLEFDKKTITSFALLLVLLAAWLMGNLVFIFPELAEGAVGYTGERGTGTETGGDLLLFENLGIRTRQFLLATFLVLIVFTIIANIMYSIYDSPAKLAWSFIFAVVIVGFFYYLLYAFANPRPDTVWPDVSGGVPDPSSYNADSGTISASGSFIIPAFLVGAISIILLVKFVLYKMERRETEEITVKEQMSDTIDRTLDDLIKGKDVRSTIIRCYAEMSKHLERQGVREDESFTPREFREKAMNELDVSQKSISSITSIFEEARYSSHELGEKDKNSAMESLRTLKNELGERL